MDTLPNFENFCAGAERADLKSLVERLEAHYAPLRAFLTHREIACLYQYKGMDYRNINRFLRTGDLPGADDQQLEDLEDTIDGIRSVIERSTLPFSTVVYRGLKRDYPSPNLAVGDYLEEAAFLSTTLSAQASKQFSLWDSPEVASTILEISVPEGTNAVWIEGISSKGEYELLLNSDMLIHISAIKSLAEYPGRRYVQCQCVQI